MSAEGGGLTPEILAADMKNAADNFDVVRSTPTTLLLDLDTPAARVQFERVFPKVLEHFEVVGSQSWLSKSGNTHMLITLAAPLELPARLALQAALGSDGVREVLSLKRMANGCEEPSLLFRPRVDWDDAA